MKGQRLQTAAITMCVLAVAGCGTLGDAGKIDYKSAGKLPPLEVPPDLTAPSRDERFAVPDIGGRGGASFSTYAAERSGATAKNGATEVLPQVAKTRIERAGAQRWLVVAEPPEKVWPVIREFWQELGFIIGTEMPEAGLMETDWAENRAKIPQDAIRSFLGKVFDSLYSTAERDKFRTRLEPGAESGSTEIYISHRGMYEIYTAEGRSETRWQPRPADPELEAEMLRRLMMRFGVEETRAQAQLAAAGERQQERAALVREGAAAVALQMPERFDRAWRRVGLALDRVGFTVEDRDRARGVYFVRYVDPESESAKKDDKGFLSKLAFWRSEKAEAKVQYRISVHEMGAATKVEVQDSKGTPEQSDTARRILGLLHEQLK